MNGMESKWSGLVLIISVCLGSYQGKARPGGRYDVKSPENPAES